VTPPLPDDGLPAPRHSIELRYVTEVTPCREADNPKVSIRSATPNDRHAIALAIKPANQRPWSGIGGQPTDAPGHSDGAMPSPNCSPCKPNTLPGATHCPTVSVTVPPRWLCWRLSNSISMSSPQSCHRADTDEIDGRELV